MRTKAQKYPDYTAEIEAIEAGGITEALLSRIINKHEPNAQYNKGLIERYEALDGAVPIFHRQPRFAEEKNRNEIINHKINNDFFSEIVDFKTGYFAGNPVAYSYSDTEESLEDTAEAGDGEAEAQEARDEAAKALTDFVALNNMFDIDMEVTKFASICGYAGRLFYHDEDGAERVMVSPPNETIILSKTRDITHPTYGVRYYTTTDINDREIVKAEFYDSNSIRYYEGQVNAFTFVKEAPNLYGVCPLQGIPNNREMLGDAEKVLELIDAYDRAVSDTNNEVDSFANAYMVYENVNIDDKEIAKAQASGAIKFFTGGANGRVYFLTKDINDQFVEHHLERLEKNIYKFSKTPNLGDESFGTASGISLKFKLTGLETKCGMFEAKMISAGAYMFQLLAGSWTKKQIKVDPLQCTMSFKRNFPLDLLSEAQAVQALIAAGVPKRVAFEIALSCVDDIEYVMQQIEAEKDDMPGLFDEDQDDDEGFNPEEEPGEEEKPQNEE